jgi:hypothetical protein
MFLTDDELEAFLHRWKAYLPPDMHTKERLKAAGYDPEMIRALLKSPRRPAIVLGIDLNNLTKKELGKYFLGGGKP